MQITGTDIQMTRGDTESLSVRMAEDGAQVPFEAGDTLYFTVKYNSDTDEKLLQKVITEFPGGEAVIHIEPEDTKPLAFGCYSYDLQLTRADGTVTTIIPPSTFEVSPEVTYE